MKKKYFCEKLVSGSQNVSGAVDGGRAAVQAMVSKSQDQARSDQLE